MSLHLIGRSCAPIMGQPRITGIPRNEVGNTICLLPSGDLTRGPMVMGTPNRVQIPITCPQGSEFFGLFHTHPGGRAEPSPMDLKSAEQYGAKVSCITNDSTTRCFKVTGRR